MRWNGFRSILCAVDFSSDARAALRFAAAIAQRARGSLKVVYVADPLLVAAAATALHDRELTKRSARELEAFVDATVPAVTRRQTRITCSVRIGDPVAEILKSAAGADLIVVGTQGLSGANRLLLGSITQGVLRRARVPVLAIPHGLRRSPLIRRRR